MEVYIVTQNKKLVSVIVIVALLGASVAPICGQGYFGSAVSRGLVAYYPFEGNADDQSGNGNHGTNNGATFVSGVSGGRALELDGKADYVLAPVNINPEVMPQLTMTAWVRPDTASGVVMSVDNGGYDRSVHVDNRGGGTGWSAFSGSGGVLGYSPVAVGEWVFLAVVYDQNAETVKLYVNDRVYEEQGRLGSGWEDAYIGKSPSFGSYFSGSIDEVRVYNYALTQSEINALYSGGTPPTPSTQPTSALPSRGLVAYYPFEGNADDQSGNGNHGTNNGATFVSGVSGGRALELDGKADYVLAPVNINPEVMPQLTMTAWVRADTASGVVMSVDNGGYDRSVHVDNRGGGTGWSAFSGSGGVLGYSPVAVGEWVFLAVVYDQDAETVKLYVNDQVYGEQGRLGSGWEDAYIGKSPSFGSYFSGSIDEVRIYNYALTQSEINALYKSGVVPSTFTPTPVSPQPSVAPTGVASLIFESRSKPRDSTVQIPLTLTGATDNIGNMDITLSYDSSVLEATEVIKGGLTTTSLFDYNILDGTVKISLADEQGFSGDGSIAYVRFTVIGSEGSSSPLRIVSVAANRADDMAPVSITTQDGLFTVLGFEEGKGDYTGDGKITAADALGALEMAVGKIPEDLVMDVNGDGKVTSLDAREILQTAVGKEELPTSDESDKQGETAPKKVEITSQRELSTEEFFRRVEGDEKFGDIYAFALDQGYTESGSAAEVIFNDGTVISGLGFTAPFGQNVIALWISAAEAKTSILVRMEDEKMILYDREGGVEISEQGVDVFETVENTVVGIENRQSLSPPGTISLCSYPSSPVQDRTLYISSQNRCYSHPNYWDEFKKCMGSDALGNPIVVSSACIFSLAIAKGSCVASPGAPVVLPVCLGSIGAALISCGGGAYCLNEWSDDPPTITNIIAEELPNTKKIPGWRGNHRGFLTIPCYKVKLIVDDDRMPKPKTPQYLTLCDGENGFLTVKDCAGNTNSVNIKAPNMRGPGDIYPTVVKWEAWSIVPNWQKYTVQAPISKEPEWTSCGEKGGDCCPDEPKCDGLLVCRNGKCEDTSIEEDKEEEEPTPTPAPASPAPACPAGTHSCDDQLGGCCPDDTYCCTNGCCLREGRGMKERIQYK
jgi:hypothetical protein